MRGQRVEADDVLRIVVNQSGYRCEVLTVRLATYGDGLAHGPNRA